jgi:hypothetical protein
MDYYTLRAVQDSTGYILTDFDLINEFGRLNDDKIPVALGKEMGYPVFETPLNDEGGNIISDGLGSIWGSNGTRFNNTVAFSFEFLGDTTIKLFSNYPLPTQDEYDELYKNTFQLKSHVETDVFECDGGTGHIDIYGKLIDENNFAMADYTKAVNHTDFESWNYNLQLIKELKDGNGKPITIHLLPMPRIADGSIQTECEISPFGNSDQRTYVNGVFVNKSYIMPIQSDPANPIPTDVEAIEAFQKAMPGYKILPIDASAMFGTGGAIHCITMQIPTENPVYIRHNAITGEQQLASSYTIDAYIKNKSGLVSQFVYYRKSTSTEWTAVPMITTSTDNYTAIFQQVISIMVIPSIISLKLQVRMEKLSLSLSLQEKVATINLLLLAIPQL